ncbi:hypothetical protein SKAU_G00203840 [Synaphobranchus kaupii]|uniref:Uncharacterized protein n=1 Tax=Synaphobranchus kaupii TaxID=118154 RepID=A0A9Q1FGD7_SYNKA|nr:hypothetical protein SKAU_G00203840 [Synaphobranchus kaupii]
MNSDEPRHAAALLIFTLERIRKKCQRLSATQLFPRENISSFLYPPRSLGSAGKRAPLVSISRRGWAVSEQGGQRARLPPAAVFRELEWRRRARLSRQPVDALTSPPSAGVTLPTSQNPTPTPPPRTGGEQTGPSRTPEPLSVPFSGRDRRGE